MKKYIFLLFVLFLVTTFKNVPAQTQISERITDADNNDLIRSFGSNSSRTDNDPVTTPLKALTTNLNYFTNGTGKAIYLTGSHTWNTLQDWGTNDSILPLNFTAFVKMLVVHHHNFTLLWTTELPTFHGLPTTANLPPDFSVTPFPWQRTGPGIGSDGKPKFDLTKINQPYFDRLRARVRKLNAAGIYAGVYLFSGEWIMRFRFSGDGYPFTGSNNVNEIDDVGGTGSVTMNAPNEITAIQDAYVEKVINTLNDLPNVLWIVSEEAPLASKWWNSHLITFIRSTGHALANTGPTNPEFLVYSPYGDEFTVNLSGIKGQFTVEWMNPATGVKTAGTVVSGGEVRTFIPPFSGDAVLYLRRSM